MTITIVVVNATIATCLVLLINDNDNHNNSLIMMIVVGIKKVIESRVIAMIMTKRTTMSVALLLCHANVLARHDKRKIVALIRT